MQRFKTTTQSTKRIRYARSLQAGRCHRTARFAPCQRPAATTGSESQSPNCLSCARVNRFKTARELMAAVQLPTSLTTKFAPAIMKLAPAPRPLTQAINPLRQCDSSGQARPVASDHWTTATVLSNVETASSKRRPTLYSPDSRPCAQSSRTNESYAGTLRARPNGFGTHGV